MSDNSIQNKTISNLFWRFSERCGAQLVSFIVSIVLARLLSPSDYGLIALVTIFTTFFQVFVDSGLGNALIQKKDADDVDFSTVFYFNICFCVLLYLLLFFLSPFISSFFGRPELKNVMRVLGLTLIISGFKNVQQAYVSKKLLFKTFFFATLIGTVIAAFVGIFMAYKGFGVWALVAQQLINTSIDTVVIWLVVKWKPKLVFSFSRLKRLLNYGWKILVASLLDTFCHDIRQLVIGKVYTSEDLAYYNKGISFPALITNNLNTSIDSVLLPVMSDTQDDITRLKQMARRSIMTSSYLMWPALIGMAAVSKNLIPLLLTEKWLACIPFLCIACIDNGLRPIQTANLNAIKALGRSDIILKLEIIKKTISISIVFITMPFGVIAIALGSAVYTIISSIINSYPNKKLLHYSFYEQIKDIIPAFLLALFMGGVVFLLPLGNLNIILKLLVQVLSGVLIYLLGSIVLKLESYLFFKQTILKFLKRK